MTRIATQLLTDFARDDEGATAVEYGTIASLIIVTSLSALVATSAALGELFVYLSSGLSA